VEQAPAAVAPAGPAGTGTAVAGAATGSAVGSTKAFEQCADAPDRKMVADVYRLSSRTESVKDMDRRKPVMTICMSQLNISPRHFGLGLPGLDISEWFGLDIRFTLNIPQDVTRDFLLLSDDGAILLIDDVVVINNDGLHGADAVMGTANLAKGLHNVRVRYFQGPGDGALMLGWKSPKSADYLPIPTRLMGRPGAAAAAPG
jgi:hypothetical protein